MICEHCGTANGTDGWRPVDADGTATHRRYRCGSCGHEQWLR